MRLFAPVEDGDSWFSRVRISGLPARIDRKIYGVDAVQALELAMVFCGQALAESSAFRSGEIESLGAPARSEADLHLPFRLHSLMTSVDLLEELRLKNEAGSLGDPDALRAMHELRDQVRAELAALAARAGL